MKKHWTTEQLQDYVAQQRQQAEARGVTFIEWNFDASHDYNKGPGNWTGD